LLFKRVVIRNLLPNNLPFSLLECRMKGYYWKVMKKPLRDVSIPWRFSIFKTNRKEDPKMGSELKIICSISFLSAFRLLFRNSPPMERGGDFCVVRGILPWGDGRTDYFPNRLTGNPN